MDLFHRRDHVVQVLDHVVRQNLLELFRGERPGTLVQVVNHIRPGARRDVDVDRVRQLVDEGLTIVSCQAQFNIPDDVTARRGESGPVLRTLYPAMARQAMFEAIAGHKTPQEGVVASTDLFPGAHRYAWQRGPCVTNDWEGMERSLRSALALGDSGVALQSHGLGCAHHPTDAMTPELYVRWLSMVVFSGNFHFQGVPALLPTAFDEKTQEHIRHWLNWRYRLIPYVLGIVEDSVRTGLPLMSTTIVTRMASPHPTRGS